MALKSFIERIGQEKRTDSPNKPVISHEAEVSIQKMPLSEFEKAGLVLTLWSDVVKEHVYFVSSDAVLNRNPLDAVAYTAKELQAMLAMEPDEVRAAHEVKKVFNIPKILSHVRGVK